MHKLLIVFLIFGSVSTFASEFVELHSNKSNNCASLQQKSFDAVEDFVTANNVLGNYTAVATESLSGGCRLFITLQNSNYKIVSKDITVYGPSVWEKGTIEERLSKLEGSLKKDPTYVLHTVSERRNSTMNKQYAVRSVSIVLK